MHMLYAIVISLYHAFYSLTIATIKFVAKIKFSTCANLQLSNCANTYSHREYNFICLLVINCVLCYIFNTDYVRYQMAKIYANTIKS